MIIEKGDANPLKDPIVCMNVVKLESELLNGKRYTKVTYNERIQILERISLTVKALFQSLLIFPIIMWPESLKSMCYMALSGKIEKIIYFPKASKRNRQKLHIDFDQARFRRFNQEKPANRVALQTSDVQARFKTANTAPQAATARKNLGRAVKG